MTKEEKFKMMRSDIVRGSGALVRHHNPAYQGIVNTGFVNDFSPHMYNNGHVRKHINVSDTETERSIGEVFIPMTTFGKQTRKRNSAEDQILSVAKL